MENTTHYWKEFNKYSNLLSQKLGRTKNIVGEYAEYLAHRYYGGEILPISHKSADIKNGDIKYQVKSRKLNTLNQSTQLSVIRSWNFDFLIVILFDNEGNILKGLEVPRDIAQEYARRNEHQNGDIITSTQNFLTDSRSKDITQGLKEI